MFVHATGQHHFSLPPRPDSPGYIAGSPRPAIQSTSSFTLIPAVTRFALDEACVIPDEAERAEPGGAEALARERVGAGAGAGEGVAPKSGDPRTSGGRSLSPSSESVTRPLNSTPKLYRHTPSFTRQLPRSALKNARRSPSPSSRSASMTSTDPLNRQTSASPPASPPMPSLLARRRSSASAKRPNLSMMSCSSGSGSGSSSMSPPSGARELPALKLDSLPLQLPAALAQLDDTVRPAVIGVAAAALTPASETMSPTAQVIGMPFVSTKKFVSTPYPEKKNWLDEEDEEDEVDSTKGRKYVASDEESDGAEESDYFESTKAERSERGAGELSSA